MLFSVDAPWSSVLFVEGKQITVDVLGRKIKCRKSRSGDGEWKE